MSVETIVTLSFGCVVGAFMHYTYTNIRTLISVVQKLQQNNHTPEEMAKKILTMKMPLDDLPPELKEELKKEAEGMKKERSYIG